MCVSLLNINLVLSTGNIM